MINNPFSLEGKTILITGASSGIGKAAAIECSKMGARVIATARNEERLRDTMTLLHGEGHEMHICDIDDSDAVMDLVTSIPEIQGLVNNAGFTKAEPIPLLKEEDVKQVISTNTVAPIMILKLLLKKKKLKAGASVVFTSSIAGLGYTVVGNGMYTASKGALSAFVSVAALELAQKNIRVNAVCPGTVETNILQAGTITEEQIEKDKHNYPLKRYGKPEDVAYAMIYLLSDASSWVTGTNLIIDGGYSIR